MQYCPWRKKGIYNVTSFLVAYCKIGIADDDGCWARYIDVILKGQAQLSLIILAEHRIQGKAMV